MPVRSNEAKLLLALVVATVVRDRRSNIFDNGKKEKKQHHTYFHLLFVLTAFVKSHIAITVVAGDGQSSALLAGAG